MQQNSTSLNILVVCTGNICRSPMAEGLLRQNLPARLKSRVQIASAGTRAQEDLPAEPHARTVMAEWGLDISGHRAQQCSPKLIRQAHLVLAMEREHQRFIRGNAPASGPKLRLLGEYGADSAQPEIPDPYGQGLFVYRACARLIRNCLPDVITEITRLAGGDTSS